VKKKGKGQPKKEKRLTNTRSLEEKFAKVGGRGRGGWIAKKGGSRRKGLANRRTGIWTRRNDGNKGRRGGREDLMVFWFVSGTKKMV